MTRLIQLISAVVRDSDTEPMVHFHQGGWAKPAPSVCYDAHCQLPRLAV